MGTEPNVNLFEVAYGHTCWLEMVALQVYQLCARVRSDCAGYPNLSQMHRFPTRSGFVASHTVL